LLALRIPVGDLAYTDGECCYTTSGKCPKYKKDWEVVCGQVIGV